MKRRNRSFRVARWRAVMGLTLGLFLWFGVRGNSAGGIIPWQPGIDQTAREIAGGHCAAYGRYAVITSIRPWPGDYIGFVCRAPGRWGPMPQ